jgi:hypothetical protein
MNHFYRDVPGLGHVAVSRHAQDNCVTHSISEEDFEKTLLTPLQPDVSEANGVLWREREGVRLIIIEKPTPFRGAKLVASVFRVQQQSRAKEGKR